MNAAKIRLSSTEMELVMNVDWILTKNSILQKTNQLLAQLLVRQQEQLLQYDKRLPLVVLQQSPKISKGDNYLGLPYLVLDYPRYFDRSGVFAIRTFFWWGHFFSITLHLAGHFKTALEPAILGKWNMLRESGFYYCVNSDEWQHHFEKTNYLPLSEMDESFFVREIKSRPFIKLAKKIPLQEWDEAENMLLDIFSELIQVVTH